MSQSKELNDLCEGLIKGLNSNYPTKGGIIEQQLIVANNISREEWVENKIKLLKKNNTTFSNNCVISAGNRTILEQIYNDFMQSIVTDIQQHPTQINPQSSIGVYPSYFGNVGQSSETQVSSEWILPLMHYLLSPIGIKEFLEVAGDGCRYDMVIAGNKADICVEVKNLGYRCRNTCIKTQAAWENFSMGTTALTNHLTVKESITKSQRGLVVPSRQVIDYLLRYGSNACSGYGLTLLTNGTTIVVYMYGEDVFTEKELISLCLQANSPEIRNLFTTIRMSKNTDINKGVHFPIFKSCHRPIMVLNIKNKDKKSGNLVFDWTKLGELKGLLLAYMDNTEDWKDFIESMHTDYYNMIMQL